MIVFLSNYPVIISLLHLLYYFPYNVSGCLYNKSEFFFKYNSASFDDFFEGNGCDWTQLNEIKYDSILAFNSDEKNVPPIEKNQELINIVPATSSSSNF